MTVGDYARVAFWMGAHLGDDSPQPIGRYLSLEQCAAYIGRTPKAVERLLEKGDIPHMKVKGRLAFDRERIDRWMERHTVTCRRGATK